MLRYRLERALEGYRWLFRAQRRWHPGPRWWAPVQFLGRVLLDAVQLTLPQTRGGIMARPVIVTRIGSAGLVVLLVAGGALVAADRISRGRDSGDGALWAYPIGGFEVAFPPSWRPVASAEQRWAAARGPVIPASTFERRTEGLVRPRHLSARAYELGEIPMAMPTLKVAAQLGRRIEGDHYALGGSAHTANGGFLTAYRFEREGVPVTQALIVFRARRSRGFMIELTGHRDDEEVLLRDAERIADSLRLDGRPLTDDELFLFDFLDVPVGATEPVRHLAFDRGQESVSGSRLYVTAEADVDTRDECRAAAVPVWMMTLGRFVRQRFSRGLWSHEVRVTCPTGSVTILYDIRRRDYLIRQTDVDGELVYEKELSDVVYLPTWGGNSIS